MNEAPATKQNQKTRLTLAIIGLVLSILSPFFWAMTLDSNFMQRTALAMWIVMAVGAVCAAIALLADSRWRTRIVASLTGAWILFSLIGYVVFTRLPDAKEFETVEQVADFTLPDHEGRPTSLAQLTRDGLVLLVFYRGYW